MPGRGPRPTPMPRRPPRPDEGRGAGESGPVGLPTVQLVDQVAQGPAVGV